jgi:hypothetical protein
VSGIFARFEASDFWFGARQTVHRELLQINSFVAHLNSHTSWTLFPCRAHLRAHTAHAAHVRSRLLFNLTNWHIEVEQWPKEEQTGHTLGSESSRRLAAHSVYSSAVTCRRHVCIHTNDSPCARLTTMGVRWRFAGDLVTIACKSFQHKPRALARTSVRTRVHLLSLILIGTASNWQSTLIYNVVC